MEKACKFGNLSACQSILQTQSGVFIDYDNYQRIKKIREYACAAKGAKECMDLSKQYKRGEGVRFSEEKSDEYRKLAILHYKERCASKDGKSCFELANFHLLYKDVFENLEEMVEHYGLACDFGYQPGCEQYKYFMDYKSYDNSEKTNKSWFGKLFSSP